MAGKKKDRIESRDIIARPLAATKSVEQCAYRIRLLRGRGFGFRPLLWSDLVPHGRGPRPLGYYADNAADTKNAANRRAI